MKPLPPVDDSPKGEIVLQVNAPGRYAGKLFLKRFQVMELGPRSGEFQLIDLLRMAGSRWHEDWKCVVRKAPSGENRGDPIVFATVKEAEAYATAMSKGEVAVAPSVKTAKAPVATSPKKASMASMARDLIIAGSQTDDQIYEAVLAQFPTFRRTSVDWYRKELKERRLIP